MPLVSGDDDISFAGNGTSEDVIISRIVFDDIGNEVRCDYVSNSLKAFYPGFYCVFRPHEFLSKNVGEFGDNGRRYKKGVSAFECMFPKLQALPWDW